MKTQTAKDELELETEWTSEPPTEKIRLVLSPIEAQEIFEIIGDAVLPKRKRKVALKTYQRLLNQGFIDEI